MKNKKINNERRLEQEISKALSHLHLVTSLYVGEHQIERGDVIPHEELWKRIKKKYKFRLTAKDKCKIAAQLKSDCNEINTDTLIFIFDLIENRDEIFKKNFKHPKMYPPRYYV